MQKPIKEVGTASSRSASGKTILGDLPPSSSETRFKFPVEACRISLPTAVEPVNATLSMSGCEAIAAPAVSPYPVIILTTPSGRSASMISSPILSAVKGVCSAGFRIETFPHASAGAIFHCEHRNRTVPRYYLSANTYWLAQCVVEHSRSGRIGLTVNLGSPPCVIPEGVYGQLCKATG